MALRHEIKLSSVLLSDLSKGRNPCEADRERAGKAAERLALFSGELARAF